jgi:hypothetical protein
MHAMHEKDSLETGFDKVQRKRTNLSPGLRRRYLWAANAETWLFGKTCFCQLQGTSGGGPTDRP